MTQLKIQDNGDLELTNNTFSLVTEMTEIRQRLLQNLRTFLGEWFLDVNIGVPYFQTIFEKGISPDLIAATFKDAILSTVGVVELVRFDPLDLDGATRALNVSFEVRTIYGTISVNEEIG